MKKIFIISLFSILCCFGTVVAQETINEFVVEADRTYHDTMTIYKSYGATPNDGVVIVNSTIPDLVFDIPSAPRRLINTIPDKNKNRYVLIIQPNDNNYKRYTITINAKGFKQGAIDDVVLKPSISSSYIVNPKNTKPAPAFLLAKITVQDKDGKPLEGAKLTDKKTGKSELTNSEGIGRIKFEREDQTISIIVSHPSYSDNKEIIVKPGDVQTHMVHNYIPQKQETKTEPAILLAKIIVQDKNGKPLEGAKLTDKKTGKSELTNSDGIGRIKFEQEDQTISIIVSHPSYSDTKDIVVRPGDEKIHTFFNYIPQKHQTPKAPRNKKMKPENFTMEIEIIGGTNWGASIDFTASYFLIGFGADMIFAPEQTSMSTLVNSGYTGNFTKTMTTSLSGSRTNVFLDLGTYFKYFSFSCQVGLLCGTTINRNSIYDGWGYGLVDGDLNEYWGGYEQRSLSTTTSAKELHLTLTPQIKGYIPIGKNKSTSISLGIGYTFIPTLNYYVGLSGCIGIHFRF